MSNDNKTLADAQPGGRVRLGDRMTIEKRARELLAVELHKDFGPASAQYVLDGNDDGCTAMRAIIAALSAQPSPGGQGDGVRCSKCKDRGYLDVDADVDDSGSSIGNIEACPHCALAARQPVGEPVDDDWHLRGYAYASKQATTCAGCGKHKHTPLRIDAMGGHVCLTCIDQKLGALLGEFGYPPAQAVDLGTGVKAIADERERQLQVEGFSRDCDQQYREGELARAATAYVQLAAMDLQVGSRKHIASQEPPFFWPWAQEWWKPVDARRDLVRAGAMIAAQIDLIDGQAVGNG